MTTNNLSNHKIYISIGSNIDKEKNIDFALKKLSDYFGELTTSPIYQSPSQGFIGNDFYNCVTLFETKFKLDKIQKILKKIEDQTGRKRIKEKFSSRTLDLDLLLYDNLNLQHEGINIPRDEIVKYAYVLKPLCDIAPECIHPILNQKIKNLWNEFEQLNKFKLMKLG